MPNPGDQLKIEDMRALADIADLKLPGAPFYFRGWKIHTFDDPDYTTALTSIKDANLGDIAVNKDDLTVYELQAQPGNLAASWGPAFNWSAAYDAGTLPTVPEGHNVYQIDQSKHLVWRGGQWVDYIGWATELKRMADDIWAHDSFNDGRAFTLKSRSFFANYLLQTPQSFPIPFLESGPGYHRIENLAFIYPESVAISSLKFTTFIAPEILSEVRAGETETGFDLNAQGEDYQIEGTWIAYYRSNYTLSGDTSAIASETAQTVVGTLKKLTVVFDGTISDGVFSLILASTEAFPEVDDNYKEGRFVAQSDFKVSRSIPLDTGGDYPVIHGTDKGRVIEPGPLPETAPLPGTTSAGSGAFGEQTGVVHHEVNSTWGQRFVSLLIWDSMPANSPSVLSPPATQSPVTPDSPSDPVVGIGSNKIFFPWPIKKDDEERTENPVIPGGLIYAITCTRPPLPNSETGLFELPGFGLPPQLVELGCIRLGIFEKLLDVEIPAGAPSVTAYPELGVLEPFSLHVRSLPGTYVTAVFFNGTMLHSPFEITLTRPFLAAQYEAIKSVLEEL